MQGPFWYTEYMQQLRNNLITLVIFFLLVFLYTKIAGPIPFSVNSVTTQKTTTFDVTGEGKVQSKPNASTISAGVTAKGTTQTTAQDQMNTTINAVSSAVKALGVDSKDIQTSNYSVNPNYEYQGGTQVANGFIASTNLTIKINDISKTNAVIDAATQAGATNVNTQGFDTSNNTASFNEARVLAIADAKKKAQAAADAAGFKLGKLVNYQENPQGTPRPIPFAAGIGGQTAQDKSTNIEPGANEVVVDVTLSYEIN